VENKHFKNVTRTDCWPDETYCN